MSMDTYENFEWANRKFQQFFEMIESTPDLSKKFAVADDLFHDINLMGFEGFTIPENRLHEDKEAKTCLGILGEWISHLEGKLNERVPVHPTDIMKHVDGLMNRMIETMVGLKEPFSGIVQLQVELASGWQLFLSKCVQASSDKKQKSFFQQLEKELASYLKNDPLKTFRTNKIPGSGLTLYDEIRQSGKKLSSTFKKTPVDDPEFLQVALLSPLQRIQDILKKVLQSAQLLESNIFALLNDLEDYSEMSVFLTPFLVARGILDANAECFKNLNLYTNPEERSAREQTLLQSQTLGSKMDLALFGLQNFFKVEPGEYLSFFKTLPQWKTDCSHLYREWQKTIYFFRLFSNPGDQEKKMNMLEGFFSHMHAELIDRYMERWALTLNGSLPFIQSILWKMRVEEFLP
ncbi:MAG TPA: hypothetical protein P5560_13255 [Thermotogota bacterium]|nr:hypothetical protein [Thermotogota bacterium]